LLIAHVLSVGLCRVSHEAASAHVDGEGSDVESDDDNEDGDYTV